MSNLGFRLLYHLLNDRPEIACERVFLPWPDLEAMLRAERAPALHARVARAGRGVRRARGDAPVRARLHERARAARPRRHPAPRARPRRRPPARARRRPLRLQPRAGRRLLRRVRRRRRRGGGARDRRRGPRERVPPRRRLRAPSCSGASPASRASTSRRSSRRATTRRRARSSRSSRSSPGYEKVERPRRRGPERAPDERVHPPDRARSCRRSTTGCPIEIQRGCTRGCRFCQVGMMTRPTRQRDPRQVLALAEAGLQRLGVRGGRAALALLRRLRLPEPAPRRLPRALGGRADRDEPPLAPDRDALRRRSPSGSRGSARPASRSRPRRPPSGCARSSTRGTARRTCSARSSRCSRTAGRSSSSTS